MLVIATPSETSDGARRLFSAAQELGVAVRYALVGASDASKLLDDADALIVRVGPKSASQYAPVIDRMMNEANKRVVQDSLTAFDKCRSYELLDAHGVPQPSSVVIKNNGEPPFLPGVLKVARGNQGRGVSLVQDADTYRRTLAEYLVQGECLYQRYIPESNGCDKRLIVCDGTVVVAMSRQAAHGDFRANLHLGGSASAYIPTDREREIACEAVRVLGLRFGGVDIIDSHDGPLVLEVNPSPGLRISDITGVDVATAIVKAVIKE